MTSAEIVKALRCCEDGDCSNCELGRIEQHCQENLLGFAADLIERLEKEKAALMESVRGGCASCKYWSDDTIGCKVFDDCTSCKEDCKCRDCESGSNWEWKGLEDT